MALKGNVKNQDIYKAIYSIVIWLCSRQRYLHSLGTHSKGRKEAITRGEYWGYKVATLLANLKSN